MNALRGIYLRSLLLGLGLVALLAIEMVASPSAVPMPAAHAAVVGASLPQR